jgi:hypothetical protein
MCHHREKTFSLPDGSTSANLSSRIPLSPPSPHSAITCRKCANPCTFGIPIAKRTANKKIRRTLDERSPQRESHHVRSLRHAGLVLYCYPRHVAPQPLRHPGKPLTSPNSIRTDNRLTNQLGEVCRGNAIYQSGAAKLPILFHCSTKRSSPHRTTECRATPIFSGKSMRK